MALNRQEPVAKLEVGGLWQYGRRQLMGILMKFGAAALVGLFLSSCGGKSTVPTATEGAGKILALDEGSGSSALEKKFANYKNDVVLDDEGNITKDSKRSNFEGKKLNSIGGDFGKKQFAASRYSKKNWSGSKNFDPGNFKRSKNRWDDEEWFLRKQARETGTAARSQGQAYSTGNYHTATAREQGGNRLARPSDVETDIRRRVNKEPLIIDQEDYEKMSLEESKSILGR